jgi:cold shock CspA family protein
MTQIGQTMQGKIISYDQTRGYGFIVTETGDEIMLSSWQLDKKVEKKLVLGSLIKFEVGIYNNRTVATNIELIEKYPNDVMKIDLPNQDYWLYIKTIHKFGRGNALNKINSNLGKDKRVTEDDMHEHGYSIRDLDYVFIETSTKTYLLFGETSPVKGDGKTDIEKYYKYLSETILGKEYATKLCS